MAEDIGAEAIRYNDEMIVLSAQLSGRGGNSADQAAAQAEIFPAHYSMEPKKVCLHGYSVGGENGSLVTAVYLVTGSFFPGLFMLLPVPFLLPSEERD